MKQTAYQVLAADDTGRILWDSGKVESNAMRVSWGGEPVAAKKRCCGKSAFGTKTAFAKIGAKPLLKPALTLGRPNGSPVIIK